MAKIKINSLLADITGKLGGLVFQRGPAGPMVRAYDRHNPTETTALLKAQSIFISAVKQWTKLSNIQKQYWQAVATEFQPPKGLKQHGNGTGRGAFIAWYTIHAYNGSTPSNPTPTAYPFFTVSDVFGGGPDIDDPDFGFVQFYAPQIVNSIIPWFKPVKSSGYYPKRGKWHIMALPTDPYGIDLTYTWNSQRQLWAHYARFLPDRLRKFKTPGQDRPIAIKIMAITETGQACSDDTGTGYIAGWNW